ncbi:MAG: SUMF1/EgtB/PvdO family nonheme iron enzyme, partial [Verrucomicrobiota bacterium]
MRVLLVDKEADLLPALQGSLLAVDGLELYCAPDGPTALQHATLLNGVDVLLTEVFQPGVDGVALRDDLQRIKPLMRTIFFTRHKLGPQSDALKGYPILSVPVNPDLFLSELLASRQAQVQPHAQDYPQNPETKNVAQPPPLKPPYRPLSHRTELPHNNGAVFEAPHQLPLARISEPPANPAVPPHPATPPPSLPTEPTGPVVEASIPPEAPSPSRAALQPGANLGPYKLLRTESDTDWGPRFGAVHTTLKRAVHLNFLNEEKQASEGLRSAFLGEASAKARAQHPSLLTVYEAAETDGHLFYAIERIEADTLQSLSNRGVSLPFTSLRRTAETVAKGLQYFLHAHLSHSPLRSNDILISQDGTPRLQNIVIGSHDSGDVEPDPSDDIATLGQALHTLAAEDAPLPFQLFLERTSALHLQRIADWDEFLSQLAKLGSEQNLLPPSMAKEVVLSDFPVGRRTAHPVLGLLLLGLTAIALVWYYMRPDLPIPRQVRIPAGQYLVGSGKKIPLPSFSIDATEITNRHYAGFVAWLRLHPKDAARYDHPEQPPHQNHVPEGWTLQFPEKIHSAPDPKNPKWDLPVTKVSWWDAYAFANWAGRALPTEEQWEAAGRGPRGFLFPWGDEPEPERANVRQTDADPSIETAPISVLMLKDASEFGVLGLCGNVSEWTATKSDKKTAVAKGN